MTNQPTTPPTEQQLDEYEAIAGRAAGEGAMAAEIRRLRAALATAQADTLAEVATELEGIDFHPNAKSSSGDLCLLLAGRFRRKGLAMLDDIRSTAGADADTLPAWLRQRFTASGVPWENLDDSERDYWAHQARAVRRAVDRGGFKTAAPAAAKAGE